MLTYKKISIAFFITIILLVVSFTIFAYILINKSKPNYNFKFETDKVFDEVNIYRDSIGIVYINSKNDFDAAFALGYTHAQERLFQMDLIRRAASGRLSLVFGSKTVPFDKMFLTLGIKEAAKEKLLRLDNNTKKILEAYSAGVNYFIKNNKANLPIEFSILNYIPYAWKPEHSLMVAKMLAWELNISWWTDFAFSHLINKFGEEKALEILPSYDQNSRYIINQIAKYYPDTSNSLIAVDKSLRKFIGFEGTHIGSNNWVVSANKSTSGKPIIANDPHLSLQSPSRWFVAIIKSGNNTTSGFTLPGLPAIVIGKNDYISWAVTNVMTDDADFYAEELDSSGTKYLLDGNWLNLKTRIDTVYVKDGKSIPLTIKSTHRGPIISDIHLFNKIFPNKYRKNSILSMRWVALENSGDELTSFLKLNKAKNYNEFKEALRYFYAPGQNFIYADIYGNIGYLCGARIPIRPNNSPSFVFDGKFSANDWKGYVPFEEMPSQLNPATGYIATANNKVDPKFSYHITNLWEPDSRINRINELLLKKEKHSVANFMEYQNDYYSDYAGKITPFILKAFESTEITDDNLKLAIKLLKKWDFKMLAESQTPTIYAFFLQKLIENTLQDELGKTYLQEYRFVANVPYRVIMRLLNNPLSTWFDNVKTSKIETRDEIIRKSLTDALTELEYFHGKDITNWQWGKIHQVVFKHNFSGNSTLVDKFFNIGPFPVGGDGTTINNGEYNFNKPYTNNLGPSMRYIYDFNDADNFYMVLPTGQSGHPFGKHYKNMTYNWLNGKYFKINTNIEKNKDFYTDVITINPNKNNK
jgi:penicillin amidase